MTARIPITKGDRHGTLTALRFVRMRACQQEWQFRCDCKAKVIRTVGSVRHSLKAGRVPMCSACVKRVGGKEHAKPRAVKNLHRRQTVRLKGQGNAMAERLLEAVGLEVETDDVPRDVKGWIG